MLTVGRVCVSTANQCQRKLCVCVCVDDSIRSLLLNANGRLNILGVEEARVRRMVVRWAKQVRSVALHLQMMVIIFHGFL